MTRAPVSLVLVGVGKMGGALLSGWLDSGFAASGIRAYDSSPSEETIRLCARAGVRLNPSIAGAAAALVVALKPQVFSSAAAELSPFVDEHTLVVSIMAGKTIADIVQHIPPAASVVRAMPNTPAAVGRGVSGVVASPSVNPAQRALAHDLLSAVGAVEWVSDESLMDAVTAVSGSGPAYVFLLAECLASAGLAAGLPLDVAQRLARFTVEGAAELMTRHQEISPSDLRRNVTSPGGTTAAALDVLMAEDGLEPLLRKAVAAARKRAEDLSG